MRPRGEVRAALSCAADALARERKALAEAQAAEVVPVGFTWREIAQRALVGYSVARKTVQNMVQAGELQPIGSKRVPGSRRPMSTYVPAGFAAWRQTPGLGDVMQTWRN